MNRGDVAALLSRFVLQKESLRRSLVACCRVLSFTRNLISTSRFVITTQRRDSFWMTKQDKKRQRWDNERQTCDLEIPSEWQKGNDNTRRRDSFWTYTCNNILHFSHVFYLFYCRFTRFFNGYTEGVSLRRRLHFRFNNFKNHWQNRNTNNRQNDQFKILFHKFQLSEEIAQKRQTHDP